MHSHFQILLRGYMELWRNLGGGPLFSCFIAFLCYNFSKSFEGVHEVPPSPSPPPPSCASMALVKSVLIKHYAITLFKVILNFFLPVKYFKSYGYFKTTKLPQWMDTGWVFRVWSDRGSWPRCDWGRGCAQRRRDLSDRHRRVGPEQKRLQLQLNQNYYMVRS